MNTQDDAEIVKMISKQLEIDLDDKFQVFKLKNVKMENEALVCDWIETFVNF